MSATQHFENCVRDQIAAEIAKSSKIAVYGRPSYDEVTEAINALTQAEFLERLSWALDESSLLRAATSLQNPKVMEWLPISDAPKDGRPKWVRGYFNRPYLRCCWAYWDSTYEGWYEGRLDGPRIQPSHYCLDP